MNDKKHKMFFDVEAHKYTDEASNVYTSSTQLLKKYIPEFDTYGKALRCTRSPNSKYYGWDVTQVINDWKDITKISLDIGNNTHNYLENSIKCASSYHRITGGNYVDNRIYTVEDVLDNLETGNCNLEAFIEFNMDIKYPKVFKMLEKLVNAGWVMFSEVCVFHKKYFISGLIDLLLIHPTFKLFIVGDWKTGKHILTPYNDDNNKWKSGYYVKDSTGRITGEYRFTNEYMLPPLHSFQSSTYVHYMIQTNIYAYLVKHISNLECKGILLSHINEHIRDNTDLATVRFYDVEYSHDIIKELFLHFNSTYNKQQLKLEI
jgi:hypothetical protein